jgi:quinol-cytochrome oxidoreductase complex cytochrome b subunit
MGPMLHAFHGPEDTLSTNAFPVWTFLNGAHKSIDGLKFPAWYFVSLVYTFLLEELNANIECRSIFAISHAHIFSP